MNQFAYLLNVKRRYGPEPPSVDAAPIPEARPLWRPRHPCSSVVDWLLAATCCGGRFLGLGEEGLCFAALAPELFDTTSDGATPKILAL